ncbi:MAG: hypothetical protein WCJ21_09850 [Planctomycetota bacterium]
MRFQEFVAEHQIQVLPADRFVGFTVDVELPLQWEQVDAPGGLRVWVWTGDPRKKDFCANAVLNLYRVEAAVDPGVLFSTMCEQEFRSVPKCRELYRDLAAANEGPGFAGTLVLEIDHEVGKIDSATRSRILTHEKETLIAELTITALHDAGREEPQFVLSLIPDNSKT